MPHVAASWSDFLGNDRSSPPHVREGEFPLDHSHGVHSHKEKGERIVSEETSHYYRPAEGACPCGKSTELSQQYSPLSSAHMANPYAFYARARKEEPIFFSPLMDAWVVTRYEDAVSILKDHRRFASIVKQTSFNMLTPEAQTLLRTSAFWQVPDLLSSGPPEHSRLRRPLVKAFSPHRIASLEPQIRIYANQLIDRFASWGRMDFVEHFSSAYPLVVVGDLLNIPFADRQQLQRWSKSVMGILFTPPPPEQQLASVEEVLALFAYFCDLAEERQGAQQDDLISDLYRAVEAGEAALSPLEVARLLFSLLVAGTQTLISFLSNCLFHLLSQRLRWEALVENPGSIQEVVEEALRFDGPVLGSWREVQEDVVIGGKHIQEGARVQVLLSSANSDEALFSQPETFDPGRAFLRRHIAFGQGIHVCLGARLARLESCVALEQLSQRLPSLRLVPHQHLSYTPNLVVRGLQQLLVEWDLKTKLIQESE
jgi:cytochrome P450